MIIIMDNSWTICQKHIKTHCQNISLSLPSKQQINHRDSEFFESPNDHSLSHACQSWLWSLCQSLAKWCMKCFVEKCTGDLTQKKWMWGTANCDVGPRWAQGPACSCTALVLLGLCRKKITKTNENACAVLPKLHFFFKKNSPRLQRNCHRHSMWRLITFYG